MATRTDGGGGGGGGGSESAFLQRSSRRSTSKTMRGAKTLSSRGSARAVTNTKNSHGTDRDRPEHPLSSISRLAAEEAAAGSGRGDLLGTSATRGGGGGGGGQTGRMMPDMSSSHRWARRL